MIADRKSRREELRRIYQREIDAGNLAELLVDITLHFSPATLEEKMRRRGPPEGGPPGKGGAE